MKITVFFFLLQIYKGYVDDSRNTDNSWMETVVCNIHDETSESVDDLILKGGDDAIQANWIDMSSTIDLHSSHSDFINRVAFLHGASW
jgi:ADP-ribose pyrophosphatase